MTRVPFLTAKRPLKKYSGAKHEMPPANLARCQDFGRKGEELVWFYAGKLNSTFSYAGELISTFSQFSPRYQDRPPKVQKNGTLVPNFWSQLGVCQCRPPEQNLEKVPRVQASLVIRCHPSYCQPTASLYPRYGIYLPTYAITQVATSTRSSWREHISDSEEVTREGGLLLQRERSPTLSLL